MRILIVTHAFPPLNSIASLRPYSWARYWSDWGHEVCVLTTCKNHLSGPLDLELDNPVRERIRIEEVPFLSFRNAQEKITNSGNSEGFQAFKTTAIIKETIRRLRQAIFGSLLDSRIFWIRPAVHRGLEIYQTWKFDLVVSTFNPPAAHIIGSELNRVLGVNWVADYRDLWHGNHNEKPIFPLSLLEKIIEDSTVKRAILITTVSDPLREALTTRFGPRVVTIENGYEETKPGLTNSRNLFPNDGCNRLVYTGSLYRGKQDPNPLFSALRTLKNQGILKKGELEVLFFGQGLEHLPTLIKEFDLEDFVIVRGFVDHETALAAQRSSDVLLFFEFNAPGVDGILTGKLFEYMKAGKPVWAFGTSADRATGRLINEAGVGVVLDRDQNEIIKAIIDLLQGKPPPYTPNDEVINRFSRQNLAQKMIEAIKS